MTEKNTFPLNEKTMLPFVILLAVFCGAYTIIFPLNVKLVEFGPLVLPFAAVVGYSLTFPITDIIGDVYGEKHARFVVWAGFTAVLTGFLLTALTFLIPGASFWEHEDAFNTVFGQGMQITFASLLAFLVSQHVDVYVFARVRELTTTRFLWARNNISTMISQAVDTIIVVVVGYWGQEYPLISLVISVYLVKITIALIDTPLVYLGVYLIKRHNKAEMS